MKVIIGLGNPGARYEHTRHNIGFLVVDAFAKVHNATWHKKGAWQALVAEARIQEERVLLVKPQTFMNRSGLTVQHLLANTPADDQDLLVIYDDADLAFGDIRLKSDGSSAGQRGMQSIIDHVGTQKIKRLRVGIGRPTQTQVPLEDWVLGSWSAHESGKLDHVIQEALAHINDLCHTISPTG